MKRVIVVMLALFLAVPALSYAGSATSRYDVTIGGMINFDFGYFPQGGTDSLFSAPQESSSSRQNLYAENGNFYFSAADSNFNFQVKGPDAWGAKTSAILGVNFRGGNTGNQFGGAQIQHAAFRLNWANSELLIGKTFQQWGEVYGRTFIIAADMGMFMNGGTLPAQIAYRYNWTKNFSTMVGVMQSTEWQGVPGGNGPGNAIRSNNDSYGRNGWPTFQYEIAFQTDACGKVGPNGLRFGLGGFLGREKKTNTFNGPANTLKDETVPAWTTVLRGFVPIIPEKKGNKASALYFTGNAFIGQNVQGNSWLAVPGFNGISPSNGSYWRPNVNGVAENAASPTFYGGMLQLTYYLMDNTFASAQYGYLKYNYSSWARQNVAQAGMSANEYDYKGPNRMNMVQQYGLGLFHDPSPNLRFGLEWQRLFAHYNAPFTPNNAGGAFTSGTGNLKPYGTQDVYKVGCMYFF